MTTPLKPDNDFQRNPLYVDNTNPSKLSDRIYLSGAWTARQHAALRKLGVTAVVNMTPDDFGATDAGLKELRVAIEDGAVVPPGKVAEFLAVMIEWERAGDVVLIHCHAGISRTSCFAIAWLMHKAGCNAESDLLTEWSIAEDTVQATRPIIMPHYLVKRAVLEHFAAVKP